MSWWLIFCAQALAGGFYHPSDVAGSSAVYRNAAEGTGAAIQQLQDRAGSLSIGLRDYEEALDLLGDRADPSERERLKTLTIQYNRQFATAQAFAEVMAEDFDTEFTAAMDRALDAVGGGTLCVGMVPDGRGVPGMRQPMKPNPDCKGEDRNAQIADKMDKDKALATAVAEILALEWPQIQLDTAEPGTAAGTGDRYVQTSLFFEAVIPKTLKRIRLDDDTERLDIQAAIEDNASKEQLVAYREQARAISEATSAKRAAVASPILDAADTSAAKWQKKGQAPFAWCASPQSLGGCTGTDASTELVTQISADKRVTKLLP